MVHHLSPAMIKPVVFGHEEWKTHTGSFRHFRHMWAIITDKVVLAILPPLAFFALLSTFIVVWNTLVLNGTLPRTFPVLQVSPLPFSLTTPALCFLLVFRTQSSYNRFDEARKQWGVMIDRTRDICRQALSYMARGEWAHEHPKRAQFLRFLQAFPLAYRHHMLQGGSLQDDLQKHTTLTAPEIQAVLAATHRPNYCLQVMAECLSRCHMDPIHRVPMETNFGTFFDDVAGSERIFNTPIPLAYTRLTSRFLFLYHFFLPLGLFEALGWLTIPVTIINTGIFFCIEEVGVFIENPFPVLALDAYARTSRTTIAELIALHKGVRGLIVDDDEDMKGGMSMSSGSLFSHKLPSPAEEEMQDVPLQRPQTPLMQGSGLLAVHGVATAQAQLT